MKLTSIISAILGMALSITAAAQDQPYDGIYKWETFEFDGLQRDYSIFLPAGLPEDAPLVVYLHGYGSDGRPKSDLLCQLAGKEKFAVCIPAAALDPQGKHGWNVRYTFQEDYEVDDIEFVCALTRHVQEKYGLSRSNAFCTGHSNGGEMCYLLAYRKPGFFNALAPLSGLTMEWMYKELVPTAPVALMEIHGTEDRTSEWGGDLSDDYWGHYISVPLAVANWAVAARCTHEITTTLPRRSRKACKVVLHRYVAEDNGGIEVQLYEVIGRGHSLSTDDFDYPQAVWDFFKKYLK